MEEVILYQGELENWNALTHIRRIGDGSNNSIYCCFKWVRKLFHCFIAASNSKTWIWSLEHKAKSLWSLNPKMLKVSALENFKISKIQSFNLKWRKFAVGKLSAFSRIIKWSSIWIFSSRFLSNESSSTIHTRRLFLRIFKLKRLSKIH